MSTTPLALQYQTGFLNFFETEAETGALPKGRNSPQRSPLGLYAEQINGSAFTAPRAKNLRSWLYRIEPMVKHGAFEKMVHPHLDGVQRAAVVPPDPMRWQPLPYPEGDCDFLSGLVKMATNGVVGETGSSIFLYVMTQSMGDRFFYSSDGEILLIPQEGAVLLKTEMGWLEIVPGEIAVVPRGITFQVDPQSARARGYMCENNGAPFELPGLGPIGANGLANPRDFCYPVARYQNRRGHFVLLNKFQDHLWQAPVDHSPFNVVAWHGNYAPYKYDLRLFNTINTVSYDHPDPSIFTVLTSPSESPGTANLDFVIFPARWMVGEDTFRPPYYHRNLMSEFMGLIYGVYDAKPSGFLPGGCSLHNCMTGHGPDADTFAQASHEDLVPTYQEKTMAFMLESRHLFVPTAYALNSELRERDYFQCWQKLTSHFAPPVK